MHDRTATFDIDVVYKQCLDRGFTQTLDFPIRINKEILIVAGYMGGVTPRCGCVYVGQKIIRREYSTTQLRSPLVVLHCCSQKALARDKHRFNLKKTLEFLATIIDELPKLHRQHDCIHFFPN